MEKNTGKSFEELVQKLYQNILDLEHDEYRKIRVERDVKIIGKSGVKHQVDVYWEFEFAGITHKTIIEVKDWKNKVKKEQIMAFYEKIQDIQGLPMGIFVAKNGFQKGALEYARYHGIKLALIADGDIMNHLYMELNVRNRHIKNFQIKVNEEWKEKQQLNNKIEISGTLGEFVLCDESGREKFLCDLVRESFDEQEKIQDNVVSSVDVVFKEKEYLLTQQEGVPKILIDGFSYDYYYVTTKLHSEVHAKEETEYLITYLLDNRVIKFNKNMHIIS